MNHPDVVEVVRCKDCRNRPYSETEKTTGFDVELPDDRTCMCPCYNDEDGWYSYIPADDFFCKYGERKA